MTIPVWGLLAFAGWTVLSLILTVGVYRWSRIVAGRAAISEFQADAPGGSPLYRRAMRAHANCIENLPVYGAVVLAIVVSGLDTQLLDVLAIVLIAARVVHTTIHVAFEQTNVVTSIRFSFFFIQLVCMATMGVTVVTSAM